MISLKHWSAKYETLTFQVCTQVLEVLDRVEITNVSVSAGHPSSSSIYPACFAPYVITTACSDGTVRFWKCQSVGSSDASDNQAVKYDWHEWEMMIRTEDTSSIKVPGLYLCKLYFCVSFCSGSLYLPRVKWMTQICREYVNILFQYNYLNVLGKPISVSCAYSGRVAIAYKMGGIKIKNDNPDNKYVNLCVSIYECESTGKWFVLHLYYNLVIVYCVAFFMFLDYDHFNGNPTFLGRWLRVDTGRHYRIKEHQYSWSQNWNRSESYLQ